MLLLLASQPSWRLIVCILAWANPPDGRRFAAAATVAAAPVSIVRRRILKFLPDCMSRNPHDRLQQDPDQIEASPLRGRPIEDPMAKPFDVQPVDASFGAVITGLRLPELDEPTWKALHATWLDYALLIFPGQFLKKDEQ